MGEVKRDKVGKVEKGLGGEAVEAVLGQVKVSEAAQQREGQGVQHLYTVGY